MMKYLFIYLAEGEPLSPGLARGVGSLEEALDPQPMTANILLFLTLFYKISLCSLNTRNCCAAFTPGKFERLVPLKIRKAPIFINTLCYHWCLVYTYLTLIRIPFSHVSTTLFYYPIVCLLLIFMGTK